MPNFIQDIKNATLKLPGQIVGGPADLANMVLGGYSNLLNLAQGKQITREVGEGLVKEPIGGAVQINKQFGLKDTETATEGLMSAVLGFANPASAVKGAIFLPAILSKPFSAIRQTRNVEPGSEAAAQVFKDYGVYKTPTDDIVRQVIDDSPAKLKQDVIERELGYQSVTQPKVDQRLNVEYRNSRSPRLTLSEVLDHPELFKVAPDLANVKVERLGGLNFNTSGAYDPASDTIYMASKGSEEDFISTLLHETQHAVQSRYDMARGGNPDMFLRDKETVSLATKKMGEIKDEATKRYKEFKEGRGDKSANGTDVTKASPEYKAMLDATAHYNTLLGIEKKSFSNYKAIAGEAEARAVQKMRSDRSPASTYPLSVYDTPISELIQDPSKVRKVDDDELIRSIIDTLISPEIQAASKK